MQNPLNESFVRQRFQRPVNRCARNSWNRLSHRHVNRVYSRVRLVFHERFIDLLSLDGNGQPARFTFFVKILVHGFKTRLAVKYGKRNSLVQYEIFINFFSNYTKKEHYVKLKRETI